MSVMSTSRVRKIAVAAANPTANWNLTDVPAPDEIAAKTFPRRWRGYDAR